MTPAWLPGSKRSARGWRNMVRRYRKESQSDARVERDRHKRKLAEQEMRAGWGEYEDLYLYETLDRFDTAEP